MAIFKLFWRENGKNKTKLVIADNTAEAKMIYYSTVHNDSCSFTKAVHQPKRELGSDLSN